MKIALGAASGLECLHEKTEPCIIHSCIKASNIFLFDSDVAKIGYPGFSRHPHYIDNILLDRPDCPGGKYYPPSSAYDAPEYAMYGEFSTMSDVYSFGVVVLELLTGRKAFDPSLSRGQQCLVTWARPRLDESKVHQCVDPRLGGDFPPKAAAKMAAVAALCTQHEKEHRPKISIMVKALRPLLVSK